MAESEGVRNFHLNSDVDSSKFAQHHTIGTKYGQAAPGEQFASLRTSHEALEADVVAIETTLSKLGKTIFYGGTASSSIPHAPANPYTSISGFTNEWGDQASGLQYQGLGVFNCTETGSYYVEANFGWASSSSGRRIVFWFHNGTVNEMRRIDSHAGGVAIVTSHHSTVMRLIAGDTIDLRMFQDSGAALNMQQSGNLIDNGSDWSRMVIITRLG